MILNDCKDFLASEAWCVLDLYQKIIKLITLSGMLTVVCTTHILTASTRSTFLIRHSVPPRISFARCSRKVSLRCLVGDICTHQGQTAERHH